jgi:hypothetical protein
MVADQFVENIVVKGDPLAGTRAFYVFEEIDPRIVRAADAIIPDSAHNLLDLFPLPGPIARIGGRNDLFDEISEAVDLDRSSPGDGFHSRDYSFYRNYLDAIFLVGFGIRLIPAVPRCLLVFGADKRKIAVGTLLLLSRRSRAAVVFQRVSVVCEFSAL